MDNVLIEKAESIERCIRRVRDKYAADGDRLETDFDVQDVIVLNLQRACWQAIDMANRFALLRRLPLPKESAEIFRILAADGVLDKTLGAQLAHMVGFRNLAVHEYQELEMAKVRDIIENRLDDLLSASAAMLRADNG
jgi:uncharacterized protein YutE (UPF0331/DUF86 family)